MSLLDIKAHIADITPEAAEELKKALGGGGGTTEPIFVDELPDPGEVGQMYILLQ